MKMMRKIWAYVLTATMIILCVGTHVFAAPSDDLNVENFSLKVTDADALLVELVCDKQVSAWGAGGGTMEIVNSSNEDAGSYFTLTNIETAMGDTNNDVETGEWSSTAENTNGGDTLEAGTWATYTYMVSDNIPADEYTFKMTFADGDNYDGTDDMTDYSVSGQSVTATYIVGGAGEETPDVPAVLNYTTDLGLPTGAFTDVKVGAEVTVDILVGGTTNQFASSEMNLTYTGLTYAGPTNSEITAANGKIKIIDHGDTTSWTAGSTVSAYTLKFTVDSLAEGTSRGTANVTLVDAALSTEANASGENLTVATVTDNSIDFNVTPADFTVTVPDGFAGEDTVAYDGTYTLEAINKNYNYTITVNGGAYTAVETTEGSGIWTIANVRDNLTFAVKSAPKEYTITFRTPEHIKNQTSDSVIVTYGNGFSFVLQDDVEPSTTAGTQYKVESIKYTDGTPVTHISPSSEVTTDRTYTIEGDHITGNITIDTSATTVNPDQFTVSLPTTEFPELSANTTVVDENGSVVLTLDPVAGYKYTVEYQIGTNGRVEIVDWTDTEATDDDKVTATISGITANVTIYVTKVVDKDQFTVEIKNEYVAIDGKTVHLVRVSGNLDEGYVYTYDSNNMYWSTGYEAAGEYVYLVIKSAGETLNEADAVDMIGIAQGNVVATIEYNGNVNLADTSTVDANDAQLVWNMYQAKTYTEFANRETNPSGATMEKFLRADMNHDGKIYTEDASAIITAIKDKTN